MSPFKWFKKGDRVRVAIQKPEQWAHGAVDALEGAVGTVESVKSDKSEEDRWGRVRVHKPECPYLVRFDLPPRCWWSSQTPPLAFHFDAHDLEVIP